MEKKYKHKKLGWIAIGKSEGDDEIMQYKLSFVVSSKTVLDRGVAFSELIENSDDWIIAVVEPAPEEKEPTTLETLMNIVGMVRANIEQNLICAYIESMFPTVKAEPEKKEVVYPKGIMVFGKGEEWKWHTGYESGNKDYQNWVAENINLGYDIIKVQNIQGTILKPKDNVKYMYSDVLRVFEIRKFVINQDNILVACGNDSQCEDVNDLSLWKPIIPEKKPLTPTDIFDFYNAMGILPPQLSQRNPFNDWECNQTGWWLFQFENKSEKMYLTKGTKLYVAHDLISAYITSPSANQEVIYDIQEQLNKEKAVSKKLREDMVDLVKNCSYTSIGYIKEIGKLKEELNTGYTPTKYTELQLLYESAKNVIKSLTILLNNK